jgi:predicted glycoside hydrolase/deacetylase ChbG (UPF0249 family)
MATATTSLIVNADDFGLSAGVNAGIIEAHEGGIVTSASLMVDRPAATEAAAYAGTGSGLSVGLHVDLGEWIFRDGGWTVSHEVVSHEDLPSVEAEVERQLQLFRQLVGCEPTHVDSHQHVHRREPARSVLERFAHELDIPLRHYSRVRDGGDFYGQTERGDPLPDAITVESLTRIVRSLPGGSVELCCHPASRVDFDSAYGEERTRERAILCDERIRGEIARLGIRPCSFRDLDRLVGTEWRA